MKPVEMPEFKYPSVRLESSDWGCLRCWTSNATPYTPATWALVKSHLKEKCVVNIPPRPWALTSWASRHDIDDPTEDDYYCAKPAFQSDYFIKEAAAM